MQITVLGHAHASFSPERATLRMRLGVDLERVAYGQMNRLTLEPHQGF